MQDDLKKIDRLDVKADKSDSGINNIEKLAKLRQ